MGTNTDRFIVTTHLSPLSRHALLMWVLLYAQEHPEWDTRSHANRSRNREGGRPPSNEHPPQH